MSDTQLFLVTPPAPDLARFVPQLTAVFDAVPVASVLLMPGDLDDASLQPTVDELRPIVQERNIAFLIDGRPELAAATDCDGVHTCPINPPYADCRRLVGDGAIVGYSCRNNRHDAMVHAELGADYIVFGEGNPDGNDTATTLTLLEWWAELMEVPCVALDRITAANARDFANAGADFLAIGLAVWDDPDGPASAAAKIAQAVELT